MDMKLRVLIVGIMVLAGCEALQVATDTAAEANDQALRSAFFTICRGATAGSVERVFGDYMPERNTFCAIDLPTE